MLSRRPRAVLFWGTATLAGGVVLACGRTTLDVEERARFEAGGRPTSGGGEAKRSTGGLDEKGGAGGTTSGRGARGGASADGRAGASWQGGELPAAAGAAGGSGLAGAGGLDLVGEAGASGWGGVAGQPARSCDPPRISCGSVCVDPASDASHCGGCFTACPVDFGCFDGTCRRLEPLTCDELVADFPVWGYPSRGLDLRPYTSSTLHWIGCATDGCAPGEFYCEDSATTLAFGTEQSILRTLVDLGDRLGDDIPDRVAGCATPAAPADKFNAPTGASDVGGVDSLDALCRTLGYSHGELVREATNFCPEPHATDPHGTHWDSDLASTSGAGAEYLCVLDVAPP